ncbi:MAG TPA: isochorismatase [Chloroflexi bacterium]|nr:isochorismatase [Chloroflexota bacterium]HHW88027.1 isochorismatase [Chloroflexota bacterium]
MPGTLPLPPHYDPTRVGQVWRVPYAQRAVEAEAWARRFGLPPVLHDRRRVALLAVDVQNTFCIPEFELFVGGRSGNGAVEDNQRLCEFIYRNLDVITQVFPTLDTHSAAQIFHPFFFVNAAGEHPAPYTLITASEIESGVWRFNAALAETLGLEPEYVQTYLLHYTRTLTASGHYALTIWPYHAMLGGIGHALAPAFEEAIFFHGIARHSQPDFQVKGQAILTEDYSALGPEVTHDQDGRPIGAFNRALLDKLRTFDAVLVAGQAKSHCVAWTVQDLLDALQQEAPDVIHKVHLLVDCMSPVVVPGAIDYTDIADAAFARFAAAGMHLVRSVDPIETWLQ